MSSVKVYGRKERWEFPQCEQRDAMLFDSRLIGEICLTTNRLWDTWTPAPRKPKVNRNVEVSHPDEEALEHADARYDQDFTEAYFGKLATYKLHPQVQENPHRSLKLLWKQRRDCPQIDCLAHWCIFQLLL